MNLLPFAPTTKAGRKKRGLCPTHHLIHTQSFSIEEARHFARNYAELRLCWGCRQFFQNLANKGEKQ
jgi:hypothetical protein